MSAKSVNENDVHVIKTWMEEILQKQYNDFWEEIRDGVELCKLLNTIKPRTCKKFKSSNIAFVARNNLCIFRQACVDVGIDESSVLSPGDLYEKRNLNHVITNLYALRAMQNKWKCTFCNALNNINTICCLRCTKANTAVVNINQICLCGREVIRYPHNWKTCRSCCKQLEKPLKTYYYCNAQQCIHMKMTGKRYAVCHLCYESTNIVYINPKHTFLLNKIASLMAQIKKVVKQCWTNEHRRRYMYSVYFILYIGCIAKLQRFIKKSELKKVQQMFNALYYEILDEITQSIDLLELGWAQDIFVKKNNVHREQRQKFNNISLKWYMLCDENINAKQKAKLTKFKDVDICCTKISECASRKRVKFIMDLYAEHFLKGFVYHKASKYDESDIQYIEIFLVALQEYTATDLLNDYFHIESYHGNDDGLKNCVLNHMCCYMLWREQRESRYRWSVIKKSDSNDTPFSTYVKTLDETQVIILEISSKIHSFINHYKQDQQSLDRRYNALKYNKFVNEMKSDEETLESNAKQIHKIFTDRTSMDDLAERLYKKGLSIKQCNYFMHSLNENEFDSDAIISDISDANDPCNHYRYSQIHQSFDSFLDHKQKFFMKIVKKHFNVKPNDDDKVTRFVLGKWEVEYWQYWKGKTQRYAEPKYTSLKEECLNNVIESMDIKTFHHVMDKAVTYKNSFKGKSIKALAIGIENLLYEVPAHLPISIAHILSVMLYCNFTNIQRSYKKYACRESHKEEHMSDFIRRNQEVGHWYKLLKEAVLCYGSFVKHGQIFYTGIDVAVSFDTYTPSFMCPLSTTIEWNVANTFSAGKGIILRLEPEHSSFDRYFDVEWLSNYKEEEERLFYRAQRLRIKDIQYVYGTEIQYNNIYLNSFRLWSDIFKGYYFIYTQNKRTDTEKTLRNLILNYKEHNNIETKLNAHDKHRVDIPVYIQQLFYHLVHNLRQEKRIQIIPTEFLQLNELLQNELLSHEPLSLYPFLQSLGIRASSIRYLKQYTWVLSEKQLDKLKHLKDIFIDSEAFEYQYKISNGNSTVTFDLGIRDKSSDLYTGFRFRTDSNVSGVFSIAIDELKRVSNGWGFNFHEVSKRYKKVSFFESKLLDNLKSLTLRVSVIFY